MFNSTRSFSSFRSSFEAKLDKHIEAINREYLSTPSGESGIEDKPKRDYNAESVYKRAKWEGISGAAKYFGITEEEVRRLKQQHRANSNRS